MRNKAISAVLLTILLVVSACSQKKTEELQAGETKIQTPSNPAVTSAMLRGLNTKEALSLANEWKTTNPEVTTFITPEKLVFIFSDKNRTEVSLPDDSMMVAVAPYIETTHTCGIHYISRCQGELKKVPVKVLAKGEDGTILIDSTMTTMENGFIELWLPRDINFTLTLESDGRKTERKLATFSDSNTCITTMQLNRI